jgi:hypothetical protein
MRRVVRCRSRASSAASNAASVRTTEGSDERNDSAAAVRLPRSTIRTKVSIARSLSIRLHYSDFRKNKIHLRLFISIQTIIIIRSVAASTQGGAAHADPPPFSEGTPP